MTSHRLVLLSVLVLIQGCGGGGSSDSSSGGSGGGGGGGTGGGAPTAPGAFSANVRFDGATQRFVATWNASQGAERYRVQLKRDKVADFALAQWRRQSRRRRRSTSASPSASRFSGAQPRCASRHATRSAALLRRTCLCCRISRMHWRGSRSCMCRRTPTSSQVASSADGNTLVIGAPLENGEDGLQRNKGVVYVFTRTGTTWNEQPTLLRAPNGEGGITPQVPGDLLRLGSRARRPTARRWSSVRRWRMAP